MKTYKLILVSFFVMFLMIGVVSAADVSEDTIAQNDEASLGDLPEVQIIPEMDLNIDPGALSPEETVVADSNDDDKNVTEIYVNDTGDDSNVGSAQSPYASIPRAMEDVSPSDDVVIHLSQGIFSPCEDEYLFLGDLNHRDNGGSLTFIGAGADKTFIDGESEKGFLWLEYGSNIILKDISFINLMGFMGSLMIQDSDLTVENCIFKDTTSLEDGGAIFSMGDNNLIVKNSQFISTSAEGGDGAITFLGLYAYLENNTFIGTQSSYSSAACTINPINDAIVKNNKFENIVSDAQYVVLVSSSNNIEMTNNTFVECSVSTIVSLIGDNCVWANNSFIDSTFDYSLVDAYSAKLNNLNYEMDTSLINVGINEINNGVSVPVNITDDMGNPISAGLGFNFIGEENTYTYSAGLRNGVATIIFSTIPKTGIYNVTLSNGVYTSEVFTTANVTLPGAVELWVSPKGFDGNNGTKENPFATIQHAIDVGFENTFEVIVHLLEGTYSADSNNVELTIANKGNLQIIGEKYGETIIDGNNTSWFLLVRNTQVTVENLKFINGVATGRNNLITGNFNLLLKDCIFDNNTVKSTNGYTLNNVILDNLTYSNNYGRIYLYDSFSTVEKKISNSVFINNSFIDRNYAGIFQAGNIIVENSKFINNTATRYVISGFSKSKNNYYANNHAYSLVDTYNQIHQIAIVMVGSTSTFENDTFENNNATFNGVFYSAGSEGSLVNSSFINCRFINNSASKAGVGTLAGGAYFDNCLFANNSADEYGGALLLLPNVVSAGKVVIINSVFDNNIAKINGNDIYLDKQRFDKPEYLYLIELNITYSDLNVTGLVDNFNATVYGPCGAQVGGSSLSFIIDGFNAGSSEIINSQSTLQYAGFEQGNFILTGDIDKGNNNIINNGTIMVNLSGVLDSVEFWVSNSGSDKNGTGSKDNPFNSISYAVGEATKNCRNIVIHIMEGTYTGDLNTGLILSSMNNLTLTGEGMDKTIIDGNGTSSFARITMGKNKVVFSNMTIMNMAATGEDTKINPIYVDSDANLCLDTVNITKFTSNIHGEGNILVDNSVFSKNKGLIGSSGLLYINNSLITSSTGSIGSNVVINNSVIKDIITGYQFTLVSGVKCIIENTLISNDCNNESLVEWGIGEADSTYNPAVAVISSNVYMNNVTVINNYGSPVYESMSGYGAGNQLAAFGYLYGSGGKNITVYNSSFTNFRYIWCVNTYGLLNFTFDGCVFNNISMIAQSQTTNLEYTDGLNSIFVISNSAFINTAPAIDRYNRGDCPHPNCIFNDNYWGNNSAPVVYYVNCPKNQDPSFAPETWITLYSEDEQTIIKNVTDGENSTTYLGNAPIRTDYADNNGALDYAVVFGPVGYLFTTDDEKNVIFNESEAMYPFVAADPMDYRTPSVITITGLSGDLGIVGVLVDIVGNPIANATISSIVGGENIANVTTDENGVFTVKGIKNGVLTILFNGTIDYFDTEYNMTFTNAGKTTKSFINFDTIESDLAVNGTLVDDEGNPIANAVITYTLNGENATNVTTDANGAFKVQAAPNAVLDILFAGNEGADPVNASITMKDVAPTSVRVGTQFNVTSGFALDVYAVDYKAGERGAYFNALLTDANGNPITGALVQFGINGYVHNKTTDNVSGVASLQINLQKANDYTCAFVFLGNETHNATFVSAMIHVNKKPITISAAAKSYKATAKTKKYTVTLKTIKGSSADGKTYLKSGKKVTMKLNGKTYTAKINAKGQATFSIKLTKKGKYTAKVSFAGDDTYKSASKSVKITIK